MKIEKMTIFLDNLPNEVLLKVFTYLNIRDLGYCAQVSKRLGDISIDESLWQKINVFNKVVPTGFIQHILKVRKSQKIFVLLSILPKKPRKFCLILKWDKSKKIKAHYYNNKGLFKM